MKGGSILQSNHQLLVMMIGIMIQMMTMTQLSFMVTAFPKSFQHHHNDNMIVHHSQRKVQDDENYGVFMKQWYKEHCDIFQKENKNQAIVYLLLDSSSSSLEEEKIGNENDNVQEIEQLMEYGEKSSMYVKQICEILNTAGKQEKKEEVKSLFSELEKTMNQINNVLKEIPNKIMISLLIHTNDNDDEEDYDHLPYVKSTGGVASLVNTPLTTMGSKVASSRAKNVIQRNPQLISQAQQKSSSTSSLSLKNGNNKNVRGQKVIAMSSSASGQSSFLNVNQFDQSLRTATNSKMVVNGIYNKRNPMVMTKATAEDEQQEPSMEPEIISENVSMKKKQLEKDVAPANLFSPIVAVMTYFISSIGAFQKFASTKMDIALILAFLGWYVGNYQYNIANKVALTAAGGVSGYPMTISVLQLGIGACYALFMWVAPDGRPKPSVTGSDLYKMLPVAFCAMAAHMASVFCLSAGAVSFGQIVKAAEPVFAAIIGVTLYKSKVSKYKWAALVPVIGGVALASMADLSFGLAALLSGCLANIFAAFKGNENKKLMQTDGLKDRIGSVGNQYAITTILAFIFAIPVMIITEGAKLGSFWSVAKTTPGLMFNLIASGLWFYAYNELSTLTIQKTNAVTQSVANTAKRVIVILGVAVALGESLPAMKLIGCTIGIGGVFLYSVIDQIMAKVNAEKSVTNDNSKPLLN